MHGLLQLLASPSTQVVAEAVVVMKNLLLAPREDPNDDTHNQVGNSCARAREYVHTYTLTHSHRTYDTRK